MSERRFPLLTVATPRLDIRQLTPADAAAVTEMLADKQTQRWLPFPRDFDISDGLTWCTDAAEERRQSGTGDHYAVVRREDGAVVGCVWTGRTDWDARATEVSFVVAPDVRGFGVAAEALDAVTVALVLELGLHRVEVRVAAGNLAARRVLEKAGFSYEGLLRDAGYTHSGRVDLEVWSMVAADLR